MQNISKSTIYSEKNAKSLGRLLKVLVWLIRKDIKLNIQGQPYAKIKEEIYSEFEKILPTIPQVAPEGDRLQGPVNFAFLVVTIRAVFVRHGVSVEVLGEAVERGIKRALLNPLVKMMVKKGGKKMFSAENRQSLINFGVQSQKKTFPLGFVYMWEHKPDDEWKDHYTILDCGICKVCSKHGATDIVPYLCKLDDILFSARGQEMQRTKTIASGGGECDFKFRPFRG